MKWWFRQQLFTQILICVAVGIILGLVFGEKVTVIQPIGDIFIRLLMMLIVPLTFLTLISGITKLDDVKSLRSLGGLTIFYYVLSSLVAGAVGMSIALLLQPGKGVEIDLSKTPEMKFEEFSFIDNLVHWIPKNPIEALATANMLQIIVFAVIVGITLLAMGKKGERLIVLASDGATLMIRITEFVMKVAPYGILALVANMVASMGFEMLREVGRFILSQYLALLLFLFFLYPILIRYLGKLNPLRFYRNIAPAMLVAASTTSSGATLPVSMGVAEENLGAPEKVWGFTLPLGATVNMDGMAACIGCIAVFSCNLYHVPITAGRMFQFMFVGLALSIGTAGVKGAGIVMSTILLQTIGLPTVVIIPILTSIWPVLDVGNTCCNVTGDLVGTTIIASRFGMINEKTFNDNNAHVRNNQ
jgi:Na+/H+-dicarboxylate symporter